MIPWVQVYSNLPSHPKTMKLAEELKLSSAAIPPKIMAVGIIVAVWTWATQNAVNGDLSKCNAASLADACGWKKKPEALVNALMAAGFLDGDMHLHDWEEYYLQVLGAEEERKEKTRERVKRFRENRRNADVTPRNADVTVTTPLHSVTSNAECNAPVTPCNASTIPYHRSIQDKEKKEKRKESSQSVTPSVTSGGGDRPLVPENDAVKAKAREIADHIFSAYVGKGADEMDVTMIYNLIARPIKHGSGLIFVNDANRRDLVEYAFKTAQEAGHAGEWRYINGILLNLQARGIETLEAAEQYDAERAEAKYGAL